MWFNVKTYKVIRNVTIDPTGAFERKEWKEVGEIEGTYAPISSSDDVRNNQYFADVRASIICDLKFKGNVQANDELEGPDGDSFFVKGVVPHENVIPHLAVYVKDSQVNRTYT